MTTATVETITPAQAEGFYNNVMEKVRDRHERGERWDVAVAHAVMGMSEWESSVIFAYLRAQTSLALVDRLLADSLARRLGLVIEWEHIELVP